MNLSIVVPFYNRESTIERCLRSIGSHPRICSEIIVVDDFSEFEYKDHGYGEKIVRLPFNQGPVSARLAGVEKSKGDWVLFLDSDDELIPGWEEAFFSIESDCSERVHGFTSTNCSVEIDFKIATHDEYWDWVGNEKRAADYILFIPHKIISNAAFPRLRMSEVWFINRLFLHAQGVYHSKHIFIYHQDSGNQLSKQRQFLIKIQEYERLSVRYVVLEFINSYSKLPAKFRRSWLRRLIKESILTINIYSLCRIISRALTK